MGAVRTSDIKEGTRARKTYKNVEKLAESIKEHGLIQPILLSNEMVLIAGGRRLRAIKHLGWEEIPEEYIKYRRDVSELELRELELLENVERENLTYQEECQAKLELDRLWKEIHGDAVKDRTRNGWSLRKSAALVGENPSNFAKDVSLAQAMHEIPELAQCQNKAEAHRLLNKMMESHDRREAIRSAPEEKKGSIKYANHHFRIGDAVEELKKMHPTNAYFAEVDPPYAVDLTELTARNPTRAASHTHTYYHEISKQIYPQVCRDIATELYRTLGEHAWVIWWFAWDWERFIFRLLKRVGFKVDRVPSIWVKAHTACASQNAKYLPARDYEQFFLARKGNAVIERAHGCVYTHQGVPSNKRTCSAEKPVELYEEIIDTLLPQGERCVGIIPFLGSGNCLRALYKKGHTGFGFDRSEQNKEYFLHKVLEDQQ
jgi:ParB family chromosome partitioning protein